MSPDAKHLVRKPRRWSGVDKSDLIVALVCSHIFVLILGYMWGRS